MILRELIVRYAHMSMSVFIQINNLIIAGFIVRYLKWRVLVPNKKLLPSSIGYTNNDTYIINAKLCECLYICMSATSSRPNRITD